MKKSKLYFYGLVIVGLVISCQVDTGFQDLTPDDGHRSHFAFNALSFSDVLDAELENVIPDTVFEIDKPEALITRSPFVRDARWFTTDTFALDPGDFEAVISVLTSTVMTRRVKTSYPASHLAPIQLGGKGAWSKAHEYWLLPQYSDTGRWWIQIHRSGGWLVKYTANAVWMEGRNVIIEPGKDVS